MGILTQSGAIQIVIDSANREILNSRAHHSMFVLLNANLSLEGDQFEDNFEGKEANLESVRRFCYEPDIGSNEVAMEMEVIGNIKSQSILQVFLPRCYEQYLDRITSTDLVRFVDSTEELVHYKTHGLITYKARVTVPKFVEGAAEWLSAHHSYPVISHLCRL